MKTIGILGSTGSIGKNTLDVISRLPEFFRVHYLAANRNTKLLAEQAEKFKPEAVAISDPEAGAEYKRQFPSQRVYLGPDAPAELAASHPAYMAVSAIVGSAGLPPTMAALEAGSHLALANKESMVMAGRLVMDLAAQKGLMVLPVDSEHSAILQCLHDVPSKEIKRIILTASGGAFRTWSKEELKKVTPKEAVKHPNWSMGAKVTVDSATLMNKCLEVIEARWFFGLSPENISVVVHPQSIVHSMVEFVDGAVLAQLGNPDMRVPIQYALTYPERLELDLPSLDFSEALNLNFEPPDLERFPCLGLAWEVLRIGGTAPVVINAANEIAVELFLAGEIPFVAIPELIQEEFKAHRSIQSPSFDDIISLDRSIKSRIMAKRNAEKHLK